MCHWNIGLKYSMLAVESRKKITAKSTSLIVLSSSLTDLYNSIKLFYSFDFIVYFNFMSSGNFPYKKVISTHQYKISTTFNNNGNWGSILLYDNDMFMLQNLFIIINITNCWRIMLQTIIFLKLSWTNVRSDNIIILLSTFRIV